MDVSSIADMSQSLSLTQTQDMASALVLKNAVDFEKTAGEETVQLLNSIPPSSHLLDMKA